MQPASYFLVLDPNPSAPGSLLASSLRLSVRHGQRLTPEQLRDEARALVEASGYTQAEVADLIGVYQPNVGGALGSRFRERASVLEAIIDALSDRYTVVREESITYRVLRKDRTPEA